jgi:diguanylate cyclase (GGDEF)-like protein
MRCLISLIIISLLFIASVFLTAAGQAYSPVFNLVVIPVAAAVIFFRLHEAVIVISASLLMCAGFLFLNIGMAGVLETSAFILFVSSAGMVLRRSTASQLFIKEKVLGVVKEEYRSFYALDNKLRDQKSYLEKTVHDISSLYQVPKEMISTTTLAELIGCMKRSVIGYFKCTKCKLIIFSFKEKEPRIETVYDLPEPAIGADNSSSYNEEVLCNFMRGRISPLIVDRDSNILSPGELGLGEDIRTFIAIPLIAGNRLNGIFAIEGALLDDMVRFIILGHQFAIVLERIRLYELMQELAITDGLTDVFVRRYFLERLHEEIARARDFNTRLSFLMLDIDYFKQCNDTFGHLVGDVVLRETAATMKEGLREIDIMGRYGGEEFSIILPETAKDGAFIVGERLRKSVEAAYISAYDERINVKVSIGITTFPDDADEINQLIDRADQALYKAKETGRNKVVAYGQKDAAYG